MILGTSLLKYTLFHIDPVIKRNFMKEELNLDSYNTMFYIR